MSKAVRFRAEGGPEVLEVMDVEIGEPGPGEVRISIEAIGLNRAEAMFRGGYYFERAENFPAKLGYTSAGVVDAVGPDVEGFEKGDRVTTIAGFSQKEYGVYGEQAIVPASATLHRPEGLGPVDAVAMWGSLLTGYGAIIDEGKVRAGDAVLITAASSGTALAAIEVANHIGATTIATTRTPGKKERLLKAGAAHVIVTTEEDVVERTKAYTGGRGADLVFDAIAGEGVRELSEATAEGGAIVVYGALDAKETPFPLWFAPTMRMFNAFGITMNPERLRRANAFIRAGVRAGSFQSRVDRTFRLDDVVDAHRYLESNRQFGKIVLTVD
ncbi:zinc-dependent alcohol dehydrogenase family protein [Amycolatopsis sp. NPDC058340]|uniref:zinc-dependent alcohol dehydrogenase family protein n=1 Tax=Amycolatopsis sp. NPDC058340 TaxID=3346453 RepID=UPI00365B081A